MPLTNPILKTKFFLPEPITDFVEREDFTKKLSKLVYTPVLLVSAPTGYGKSTTIANWLRKETVNHAWLTLSELENNFQHFILYFTHAIRQKINDFGQEIIELNKSPEKLPAKIISDYFLNAFSELDKQFILVLDDYHLIRNAEIHQFISSLFSYPQPFFRLIISTRRDPNLPLSDWRMKNLLFDIRANDLRFSHSEINTFLEKFMHSRPDDQLLNAIESASEGWITGLRLVTLSVDKPEELIDRFLNHKSKESHILNHLIKDILKRQSPEHREYLLKLSLLNEFNEALFNEVCLPLDQKALELNSFSVFIEMLTHSNMFLIPLDDKRNWYRFHHLFSEMIYQIAQQELSQETRNKVLELVANWLNENHLTRQSIEYYLKAGKDGNAIAAFRKLRTVFLAQAKWPLLDQIFALFPENLVDQYSTLSLTKGWLHIYKGNIPEMISTIDRTEKLILSESCNNEDRDNYIGEIEVMRAYARYNFNIDMEKCLEHSKNALEKLASTNTYLIGMAWIFYGGSMQALTKSSEGKKKIYEALYNSNSASLTSNLLLILCYIEWLNGNLASLKRSAAQLITFGEKEKHKEAQANGWYFYGMAMHFMNENQEALKAFEKVYELRYFTLQVHSFFGILGLACILVKLGNIDEAEAYMEELENSAMERGGPVYIQFAKAFIAEFNYLSLHNKSGLKWAKETHNLVLIPMSNLSSPQISQIRILAEDDDPKSWKQAGQILDQIIPFLERYNNSNFLIRALALNSYVSYKQGDRATACDTIKRVLALSEPRGFVRPFIDLGSQMSDMLEECRQQKQHVKYIDDLLQHMIVEKHLSEDEQLTSRETQILQLLGSHMSNKEVGNKLFISEATVKRHIANIFKKLKAANRKEALVKAKELELV